MGLFEAEQGSWQLRLEGVTAVQVGKSLLIRCLIKHYTRQSLSEVRGPITVVSGKARRLTFVECPQASPPPHSVAPCARLSRLSCACSVHVSIEQPARLHASSPGDVAYAWTASL